MAEKDYVLGTHDAEVERLGLQHRVWRPRVSDAWRRAGFGPGQTLVDLGCGPGWATLDLAEIAGPRGRAIGIDRSRRFLDVLESAARARALAQVQAVELDLDEDALPDVQAHGVWSRWVYAFVKKPRQLVERAAAMLAPGGTMVLLEYVDYRAWRLSPRHEAFEAFVGEVMASWRDSGGEPDVGVDLPRWLADAGLEVREARPITELARPGDYLWQWPRAFVDVGLDRLVELGRVTPARAAEMRGAFDAVEAHPAGFTLTPTVLEIVAVKR